MLHEPISQKDSRRSDTRVKIAVDMVEVCVDVCADGIRSSKPRMTERELLETLRSRLASTKRH